MVIVAISAYVVSSRLAAAERDRAEALEAVESVLSTYEAHLAEDPLYFLHHVSPYEEARVCVLGPVDQVVQPGSEWPGNCGTRWEYTKPTGEDQREHRTVRLKVEAPSPHRPYLTLQAVAAVGSSRVARERTFTVRSVATSLIYADQDLFIDAVARELSVPLEVSGDIYTGGRLFLPSVENVDFSDTLLMAEGGFTPQVAIRPSQFVRFFARNPDGSGLVEDLSRIVPTPYSPDRLTADLMQLREVACSTAGQPGGDNKSGHLCIVPGKPLPGAGGGSEIDKDARTFLLKFKVEEGEQKIELYYSTNAPGFVWDCQIRCSLPMLAATEVEAGTHMGAENFWTYVGEFAPPPSGVIFVDGDVSVGLCGDAFLKAWGTSNVECAVSELNTAITVVAGTALNPKNVYLSGPIDTSDEGGRLGVVSSGMTFIPYWARQPGGQLKLDVAITALGLGDDISKGRFRGAVSTLPVRVHRGFTGSASNRASLLHIRGSIAGSGVDLSSNQYDSIRLEWDPRLAQDPPPYYPSFLSEWTLRSENAISPDSLCDNCAAYVTNG